MVKIVNDKYYTPKDLALYCINKTYEVIGKENIVDVIEPSAGAGSFSTQIKCRAYDIAPEYDGIVEQDYLTLLDPYRTGRLVIGNPPYGRCLSLAQKFYKKSVELGDYIAFVLPISQLDNTQSMYEFDLVYSEDLGKRDYSGVKLHCCFNIYRRPSNGLNKPKKTRLRDVSIVRQDAKRYNELVTYDLRMCYWGNGSAGKILTDSDEKYSGEYKIIINNPELREEILRVLTKVDWHSELNKIAMLKIQQFHICELLLREIPEIE